jgi:hypothetical protein
MDNRFDGFTATELTRLWVSLYEKRQAAEFDHVRDECRALENEILNARNWAPAD